jgi:hypothetical protein
VAWTLYDVRSEGVYEKIQFGYGDDFVGIAAFLVVGFVILFTLIFVSLKVFNFQKRDRIDVFK